MEAAPYRAARGARYEPAAGCQDRPAGDSSAYHCAARVSATPDCSVCHCAARDCATCDCAARDCAARRRRTDENGTAGIPFRTPAGSEKGADTMDLVPKNSFGREGRAVEQLSAEIAPSSGHAKDRFDR